MPNQRDCQAGRSKRRIVMKMLILMRHAKAIAKAAGQSDYDRALEVRGRREAARMAARLEGAGHSPDAVLASGARRVRETWESMVPAFSGEMSVTFNDRLYLAEARELAAIAATAEPQAERLMVLGHNPGMASWIDRLTGAGEAFPTAAIALIELAIGRWSELDEDSIGQLVALWTPRDDA